MRNSVTAFLRRSVACVTLASLLLVSSLVLPRGTVFGQMLASASATICSSSSKACPQVVGVSFSATKEASVTMFLFELWRANATGGTPLLGRYQLQQCANPGSAPYRVTCVLWSTGTRQDLSAMKKMFTSSRLFTRVTATFPKK